MDVRRRVTLDEWEAAARRVLPTGVFDYVADGQAGVEAVLGHLRDGFVSAMANAGCRSVDEIDDTLLHPE